MSELDIQIHHAFWQTSVNMQHISTSTYITINYLAYCAQSLAQAHYTLLLCKNNSITTYLTTHRSYIAHHIYVRLYCSPQPSSLNPPPSSLLLI